MNIASTGMSVRTVSLRTPSIKHAVGMNVQAFVTELTMGKCPAKKHELICQIKNENGVNRIFIIYMNSWFIILH